MHNGQVLAYSLSVKCNSHHTRKQREESRGHLQSRSMTKKTAPKNVRVQKEKKGGKKQKKKITRTSVDIRQVLREHVCNGHMEISKTDRVEQGLPYGGVAT